MASYDAVAACLRNGRWETLPTSHSLAHILQPTTHFRFACRDPMQTMQRHRWKPDDPSCSGILELDPLAASFGGMFADPERPVFWRVLGESISETLVEAVNGAIRLNPHLVGIKEVDVDPDINRLMSPLNLAAIPSTINGTLRLMNAFRWPANATRARRFLFAMSANWYNIANKIKPGDQRLARPNHDEPDRTPCLTAGGQARVCTPPNKKVGHQWATCSIDRCQYGGVQWGHYAWVRRAHGTVGPVDYAQDLRTFAAAAGMQREAQVVWIDSLPQHCEFDGKDGAALKAARNCEGKQALLEPRCWALWPYFGEATEADVAPEARKLVCPHLSVETTGLAGCEANVSRWRYQVLNEALRDSPMPVVPLEAAMATRGELHTDCTHWCHPTEMGVHMAAAVLNVMAALLRDQQQHERRPHEHHHGGAHEQQRPPPA